MTPKEAIRQVFRDVCREFGIRRADLFGKDRSSYFVRARIEAVKRLRLLGLNNGEIARRMNRHYTSIIHLSNK